MDVDQLNLPVQIADAINAQLAVVGIILPLAVTQFFTLVLCLAALAYGVFRLRKDGVKDLLGLLVVIGFGLFAAGITYAWVEHAVQPVRGSLAGQVDVLDRQDEARYQGMRVSLLDFRGDNVAHEAGFVDSRNGFFALTYEPVFADPPRTLRIEGPNCQPYDFALSRSKLASERPITVPYRCGESG
jgi:hypothetical protein